MPPEPVPPDAGRDEDPRPVPPWPDWMDDPAYLALRAGDEDPGDLGLDDPDDDPPPDVAPGELATEAGGSPPRRPGRWRCWRRRG
ncbi:MAG TPA: hypothetical protein VJ418_02765 [Streptosporangiaceae bacterium]|nr:hypothetical protein [Streptosporangiaceae bacterium]